MLSTKAEERKRRDEEREELAMENEAKRKRLWKYRRMQKNPSLKGVSDHKVKRLLKKSINDGHTSATHAARTELIYHQEQHGLIETEGLERSYKVSQEEILEASPVGVTKQYFNLTLNELGPYCINYSRNGRHVLLGGRKGHVAAFDWRMKKLKFEIQLQQTIRDVQYLHSESMFAAAQKNFVYIYDNTGTELHCMKKMEKVNKLTFLPYHFLLVSANEYSVLSYLDVSTGQFKAQHRTGTGPLRTLSHNPYNGVVHLGHHNGTVSLWTPNCSKPIAKILCHKAPVTAIDIDNGGWYMATTGMDARLNLWDIRQYKTINSHHLLRPAVTLDISQRRMLALAYGTHCEVWQDPFVITAKKRSLYLQYDTAGEVHNVEFCPFEDCLAIGHRLGMSSIIVPGAGEANIDGLEVNPFETRRQKREWEVKALLDKIPADLITLNPDKIGELDDPVQAMKEIKEAQEKKKKPAKIKFKMKGRSAPSKLAAKRQEIKDKAGRVKKAEKVRQEKQRARKEGSQQLQHTTSVLDRFRIKPSTN